MRWIYLVVVILNYMSSYVTIYKHYTSIGETVVLSSDYYILATSSLLLSAVILFANFKGRFRIEFNIAIPLLLYCLLMYPFTYW